MKLLICAMTVVLGGCAAARLPCDAHLTPINPPKLTGRGSTPAARGSQTAMARSRRAAAQRK